MTVVAYSRQHRIVASDSRCSDDGMHFTRCKKVFRLASGAILGTAGDADDRELRALLGKATPRKMPTRAELAETKIEFVGLLVFPAGRVFVVEVKHREFQFEGEWSGDVTPVTAKIVAIGCGHRLAYGAMQVGASPEEAVRAACKWDTACALPVQAEKLR